MALVHLVLGELPGNAVPTLPVHLVLGETGDVDDGSAPVGLTVQLRLAVAASVASLSALGSPQAVQPWGASGPAPTATRREPWAVTSRPSVSGSAREPWTYVPLVAIAGGLVEPWASVSLQTGRGWATPWAPAASAAGACLEPWAPAALAKADRLEPWGLASMAARDRREPWTHAALARIARLEPWTQAALLPASNQRLPRVLGPGAGSNPGRAALHLVLCEPFSGDSPHLVLGDHNCIGLGWVGLGSTPERNSYVHTHALQAVRLPDLTVLPVEAFSVEADAGSYAWTVSLTGRPELMALLAPTAGGPARVSLTLDGITWEARIESLRTNRSFNSHTVTATGRSESLLLGEGFSIERALLNTAPATAQQLALDAMQTTGVALTWGLTDWLVPAGAWSFSGTPLAAVRRIAEAAGGILQSPRVGASLIVAPRYPIAPWVWGAAVPDVVVAWNSVESLSLERADRPAYEGVYVSGQAQGVLALVRRTGTAPALLRPLVTDPLITHLDAARQRGLAELGPSGPMATQTITLPVLTGLGEPGVIDVGRLVQVPDPGGSWRGLVRGVRVQGDHTVVRQNLILERHL